MTTTMWVNDSTSFDAICLLFNSKGLMYVLVLQYDEEGEEADDEVS